MRQWKEEYVLQHFPYNRLYRKKFFFCYLCIKKRQKLFSKINSLKNAETFIRRYHFLDMYRLCVIDPACNRKKHTKTRSVLLKPFEPSIFFASKSITQYIRILATFYLCSPSLLTRQSTTCTCNVRRPFQHDQPS